MDVAFSISLPRRAYTVAVARDMLGTLLHRAGLCRDCVDDFLLAASEACANAVEHGGPVSDYRVDAEIDEHWCEVRISHTGRAPDTEALAARFTSERPPPLPGLDSESGRGILLMRRLMDEVSFEGEPRVTVLLRKRRTSCDEDPGSAAGRVPAPADALLLDRV
ncbi:ATP-binding protein [Nocardiopsis flavescens]|uniref:Serine/threonine-protein kinase RsbW n=1 Tax=Nocardiopsis flavescens TaxID=758803 RepID=A0A1M6NBD5_9ACTN|nr:ATP-binding protein [Nocardiopsis flavescens]SHJ92984.1 serine/threonine-protein kinase RsbW [Nocardiopsis flavescens]